MTGEVVVVPVANPIGLAQQVQGYLRGRYEDEQRRQLQPRLCRPGGGGGAGAGGAAGAGRRRQRRGDAGGDGRGAGGHAAAGRDRGAAALAARASRTTPISCSTCMPTTRRCCTSTSARRSGRTRPTSRPSSARARCCSPRSPAAIPFDEACGGPWWALAPRLPRGGDPARVPRRDGRAALEQRRRRAARRGRRPRAPAASSPAAASSRGESGALPAPRLRRDPARGDAAGDRAGGGARRLPRRGSATASRTGETVAEIVDPLGGTVEVAARGPAGVLFARHDQPIAWPGKVIGKIAGERAAARAHGQAAARLSRDCTHTRCAYVVHGLCIPRICKLRKSPAFRPRAYFSSESRMLVSEFATAFSARIPVSARSRAARSAVAISATRSQRPLVEWTPPHLRHPAQRGDDGAGVGRADLDRHDRPHPGAVAVARRAAR